LYGNVPEQELDLIQLTDLDRDRAIQARISRFVNLALPTRADGGEDFRMGQASFLR